ncbi:MAG: transcriptional regulator GcvA [Pseudomonadota bacterium]
MAKRIYPLNALRAFEAAARHLSFVKAADELHVTPAAISHQVKSLEDFLGVQLFRRLPKGLLLNDVGQLILPDLRDGFARLDRAMERVRDSDARAPLSISVAPAFAAKWLVPRLERFNSAFPGIDVRISARLAVIDFQRDAFDAAIRLGRGVYEGLHTTKLFDEFVTPMCSPRLLEGDAPLRRPDDLQAHALIHDDSLDFHPTAPKWPAWLKAAAATEVDAARGAHFSHPDHSLQAAIDGAGVALGWTHLAAADLAAGRLVAPFDLALPMGLGFYLVCPEGHVERPNVAKFRHWILEEIRDGHL